MDCPDCAPERGVLIEAVPRIARRCEERAASRGRRWINERDDLQPVFNEVLGEIAEGHGCRHDGSGAVAWPEWPRVGRIDAVLQGGGDRPPAYVELKCGSDSQALTACWWDLLKLSVAVGRGEVICAYLLAATTGALWDTPTRGAETLGDGSWTLDQIRGAVPEWWTEWERRNDPRPLRVPGAVQTCRIAAESFSIAGTSWEIRLSRVCHPGEWRDWVPFTSDE